MTKTSVSGWGNVIKADTELTRPESLSSLQSLFPNKKNLLAYGCGRSYGDVALNPNGLTILTTKLNRLLQFDPEKLTLTCEAGVTLHDIQNTFLPRGIALVTSPGTSWVTVGGAIANDVHGKNHDRVGSFGNQVHWLELLLPNGELVHCSPHENHKLFIATLGGLGLTGIITKACIQLQQHPQSVEVHNEIIPNLAYYIDRLIELRSQATYSVGWIDSTARGQNLGRGILSTAEPSLHKVAINSTSKTISCFAPNWLLNPALITAQNKLHYWRHRLQKRSSTQAFSDYLYPLDSLNNWNRLYGKRGFYQFQCVIPDEFAQAGLHAIMHCVKSSKHLPSLTVIKTLGSEGLGLLSFPLRGITLALDFANSPTLTKLLQQLEAITLQHHGRLYFAKDACASKESLEIMYPKIKTYQEVLDEIDPTGIMQSQLAQRLKIRTCYD